MKKGFLLIICYLISIQLTAQDKHLILFNTKDISGFSSPSEFLSAKAIERREKQGITIQMHDYPVTAAHLDALRATGATVLATTKWLNGALVEATNEQINEILALSFVRESSDIATLYGGTKINEVQKITMLDYGPSNNQNEMIGANLCHEQGFTGTGMTIAVFDAGFPEVDTMDAFDSLRKGNHLKGTYDFVMDEEDVYDDDFPNTIDDFHGTRVLSTMAAYSPGELIGTAFTADYYLFVTEDVSGESPLEEFNWLLAAERADSVGVDIINSSVGYYDFDNSGYNYSQSDLTGDLSIITRAADFAAATGILVVNSAGNEGSRSWGRILMPADGDSVLTVGAVSRTEVIATFSSRGPTADGRIKPDVMAMGVGTVIFNPNGSLRTANGTSFAAPVMAGFAACVWQAFPDLSNMELIEALRNAGDQSNNPNNDYGYGIPHFNRISPVSSLSSSQVESEFIKAFPNPSQDGTIHLYFDDQLLGKELSVQVFTATGKLVYQGELKLQKSQHQLSIPQKNHELLVIMVSYDDRQEMIRVIH